MSARDAYAESLGWIYALGSEGMKFGLGRMRRALKKRGRPDAELRFVHVAGSNGKGSTCAMIERGLRAAGYKTGWFSSPHLHRYAERFRVDGRPLGDAEVARRLADFREADLGLTFFEYSVLLAFEAFRDHGCDVVVLEVGLGGRLDATNTIEHSELCVVTNIALEHTAILGDTKTLIAKEKGGIFRRGALAVIGAEDAAQTVLQGMAKRREMDPWCIAKDFRGTPLPRGRAEIRVGRTRYELKLSLAGAYQVHNASVAAAALHRLRSCGFRIPRRAVETALTKAKWPGRLERLVVDGVEYILDAAHNPDGCQALAAHLETLPAKKTTLLFGALADKDHEAMLAPFDGLVDSRVYALPAMRRAANPASFSRVRKGHAAKDVDAGLRRALQNEGRIVVAGSIFLVSAVRARVLGLRSDPPIAL
ncbi:MAG: dihydrofolate synthase/folylpolyglutamate synthase [Polyangiales bacterium]|jgi:dihydrofolate synthase/folylpolyglutamate synthase